MGNAGPGCDLWIPSSTRPSGHHSWPCLLLSHCPSPSFYWKEPLEDTSLDVSFIVIGVIIVMVIIFFQSFVCLRPSPHHRPCHFHDRHDHHHHQQQQHHHHGYYFIYFATVIIKNIVVVMVTSSALFSYQSF